MGLEKNLLKNFSKLYNSPIKVIMTTAGVLLAGSIVAYFTIPQFFSNWAKTEFEEAENFRKTYPACEETFYSKHRFKEYIKGEGQDDSLVTNNNPLNLPFQIDNPGFAALCKGSETLGWKWFCEGKKYTLRDFNGDGKIHFKDGSNNTYYDCKTK